MSVNPIFGSDAFSPREIAEKIETIGVAKTRLPLRSMIMSGILAGVFIGLGAMYYVLVVSDTTLGFGLSRLLGGLVFSLGLIMVFIAGLAVWMSQAGRSVSNKMLVIIFLYLHLSPPDLNIV